MTRQSMFQAKKESQPLKTSSLFRRQAAQEPVFPPIHLGQDHSGIPFKPVHPAPALGPSSISCPFTPERCPFGGACHACPPKMQAKLKIGQPGDRYEQEADRVAEQVMRMPEPQVQRKCSAPGCKDEDDEKKLLQTKPASAREAGDHPLIRSVLSSPGQPLDAGTRSFMEPRFGQDFSGVRVHVGCAAAESARAVNARAYTVGRDVVFGEGQYAPGSDEGKRLMAHELAHVGQQQGNQEGTSVLQRWAASEHGRITKKVISDQYAADLSKDAILYSAYYSGQMDLRIRNYLWYFGSKIPMVAPVVRYALDEREAPNHGEANLYENINTESKTGTGKQTWVNIDRMTGYANRAAEKANGEGINKQIFIELGLALHVGQDRGAHDEGLAGQGHSKPNWKPDDPSVNAAGHAIAMQRTREVLDIFLTALTENRKKELKVVVLGDLSMPSPVVIGTPSATSPASVFDDPQLPYQTPIFYMGFAKGMFMDKSGLPLRIGGIFPPLYNTGLVYRGGKGNTIAFDQQIGLRMLHITPKVYVDVLGGGVLGVNFNDKSVMAGISAGAHLTYMGQEGNFGVMLNKIWDIVGDKNLLVIGVSGSFD